MAYPDRSQIYSRAAKFVAKWGYPTRDECSTYDGILGSKALVMEQKTWKRECPTHGPFEAAAPNQRCKACKLKKQEARGGR